MKASIFSDAQKAFILTQASDGMPVADIAPASHLHAPNLARLRTVRIASNKAPTPPVQRVWSEGAGQSSFCASGTDAQKGLDSFIDKGRALDA